MTRTFSTLGAIAIASTLTVACGFEHTSNNLLAPTPGPTQPPPGNNQTPQSPMLGMWVSAGLPPNPSPNTCANFRYQVTAHVGTTITDPNIDYAKVAQGLGVYAEGPIENPTDLAPALKRAIAVVKRGEPALVDVVTQPR